nr:MAG TPA: hypothetical protein [Caudoviricetes sp.]DAS13322.1 MAG TPA: hypothetical protein [Caudoviricetes sp.]
MIQPILQPLLPIWNICLQMRYEIFYFVMNSQDICFYLMLSLLSERLISLFPKLLELSCSTWISERPPNRSREES